MNVCQVHNVKYVYLPRFSLPVKYRMEYTHLSSSFQEKECCNCCLSRPQDWTIAVWGEDGVCRL